MGWKVDDYVLHKKRPGWGVGKIYKANAQDIEVFFVGGGRRVLAQPAEFLQGAPDEMAGHPLLANLAPAVQSDALKFMPLPERVQYFLKLFPGGFYDPVYLSQNRKETERIEKADASELARTLLSEPQWSALARDGDFAEVCRRLARVESKTNLLHTMEKIKLNAALKDASLQKLLAEAFFEDIYGAGSRMSRFATLSQALESAEGCAKWPVATYFGFLLHPESRIFVKPEVTKFAAEACGWDLQYQSSLNWNTLSRAEGLAGYLFGELTRMGLKPRDMIDIQSFIWCIEPGSYGGMH